MKTVVGRLVTIGGPDRLVSASVAGGTLTRCVRGKRGGRQEALSFPDRGAIRIDALTDWT